MALSQPYKDLIDDGVFASSDAAERLTPAEAGSGSCRRLDVAV